MQDKGRGYRNRVYMRCVRDRNVGSADFATAVPIAAASSEESGVCMTEACICWVWRGQTLQAWGRRRRNAWTPRNPAPIAPAGILKRILSDLSPRCTSVCSSAQAVKSIWFQKLENDAIRAAFGNALEQVYPDWMFQCNLKKNYLYNLGERRTDAVSAVLANGVEAKNRKCCVKGST